MSFWLVFIRSHFLNSQQYSPTSASVKQISVTLTSFGAHLQGKPLACSSHDVNTPCHQLRKMLQVSFTGRSCEQALLHTRAWSITDLFGFPLMPPAQPAACSRNTAGLQQKHASPCKGAGFYNQVCCRDKICSPTEHRCNHN